ncbi:MAG: hypothetical protein M0Q92_13950 [Methanoregula sp.]|jgi:hypothetical protein|nr:hypothetical protein [Methanoregula sp.]
MRTIVVILIIVLCLGALVQSVTAAKDDSGNSAGPANGNADQPQVMQGTPGAVKNQSESIRETVREEEQAETRAGNASGIIAETRLQEREDLMTGTGQAGTPAGQNIARIRQDRAAMNATLWNQSQPAMQQNANQNQVRLAVHTLLAMQDVTGGIGQNVSALARGYNNSVQATWQLEERIQGRNAVSRFFFGGDQEAAGELAGLTIQNENRIRQMEQLMNSETLDAETRLMLEEQLQIMEQENTRLNQVSSREQQDRGIFGGSGA